METKKYLKKLYIYATVQDNRYLLEYRELDELGKIITEVAFYPDGTVYEKVLHTYIGDHVLQSNYFSGNDEASHTVSFNYDEDGQIEKESTWYADGSLSLKTFVRDKSKRDETIYTKDEDGNVEEKLYFLYNEKQLPILEVKYDEKGETEVERIEYEYNEEGFISKIDSKPKDEAAFLRHFEYVKDDYDNIIETHIETADGQVVGTENRSYTADKKPASLEEINHYTSQYKKTTWQYDERGNNTVIRQFNVRGELNVEILLEYNEKNQIVVEETRSSFSGVTLKEYVYEYSM